MGIGIYTESITRFHDKQHLLGVTNLFSIRKEVLSKKICIKVVEVQRNLDKPTPV